MGVGVGGEAVSVGPTGVSVKAGGAGLLHPLVPQIAANRTASRLIFVIMCFVYIAMIIPQQNTEQAHGWGL